MLNEGRIKYSCKLLSYIINFEYEELLENMSFSKNYFDKDVVKNLGFDYFENFKRFRILFLKKFLFLV